MTVRLKKIFKKPARIDNLVYKFLKQAKKNEVKIDVSNWTLSKIERFTKHKTALKPSFKRYNNKIYLILRRPSKL